MTTPSVDGLVDRYLAQLHAVSRALPPDRAWELVEGISEHIAAARAEGRIADEASVRSLLDRLGSPEEIVREAQREDGVGSATSPFAPPSAAVEAGGGHETAAVVFLTAGSLLPLVGWLIGFVLLWTSRIWRPWEKLLGTLVVPGGPGVVLLVGLSMPARTCISTLSGTTTSRSCSDVAGRPGLAVLVVLLVAPFVVGAYLHVVARRRATGLPPVPRPDVGQGWGALEVAAVLLLALGAFVVPVVGPVVGLVLLAVSPRWSVGEKAGGFALTLVPWALLLVVPWAVYAGGSLTAFGAFTLVALVLTAAGPLLAALYLFLVLHGRVAA